MRIILKTSPEPMAQIQNNFTALFLITPSTKIAQMVPLACTEGLPELWIRNIFKQHFLFNHWLKFKIISQNYSSWCILPKLLNGCPLLNKGAPREPPRDFKIRNVFKRHLLIHWSQLQNDFTESCFSWCTLPKWHKGFCSTEKRGRQSSR